MPHVTWGDSTGLYDSSFSWFSFGWLATPIDTSHAVGMVSAAARLAPNGMYGVAVYSTGPNTGATLKLAVEGP